MDVIVNVKMCCAGHDGWGREVEVKYDEIGSSMGGMARLREL